MVVVFLCPHSHPVPPDETRENIDGVDNCPDLEQLARCLFGPLYLLLKLKVTSIGDSTSKAFATRVAITCGASTTDESAAAVGL